MEKITRKFSICKRTKDAHQDQNEWENAMRKWEIVRIAIVCIVSHSVFLSAQSIPLNGYSDADKAKVSLPLAGLENGEFIPDIHTVGLWHFNENAGDTAFDSSGNGLHGILQNGASWDAGGKFGSCISFASNNQRICVPDTSLLDLSNEFTLDAWIYLLPTNNRSIIVSKWNNESGIPIGQFIFIVWPSNHLCLWVANESQHYSITTASLIPTEEWILVSAVFNKGLLGIFINGSQVASGQAPFDALTSIDYPNDDLYIGDLWTDTFYPYSFEGKIDEVRISNSARYALTHVDNPRAALVPEAIHLSQNRPNPFNATTVIEYVLSKPNDVELSIHNILGQEMRRWINPNQAAGSYREVWDGTDKKGRVVPSGLYFYRLKCGDVAQSKKMVLMK